jgi:hypothetical protein
MELVVSAAAPSEHNEKAGATSAKNFHVLDKSPKSPMKLARRKLHLRRSSGALGERGIPLNNSYFLDDLLQGRLNLWGSG